MENTREAHVHYRRGNAFAALQQPEQAAAAWRRAAEEPESTETEIADARRKAREALARTGVN
jgi:hypothetical protein